MVLIHPRVPPLLLSSVAAVLPGPEPPAQKVEALLPRERTNLENLSRNLEKLRCVPLKE